jgi:hypothetical protein
MNEPANKPKLPAAKPGVPRARRRPGFEPKRRKFKRKPNWIYLAGCLLLMVAFFLPWFSTGLGSVFGYEIPYHIPRFLNAVYAPPDIVLASNSLWALAFIGVFAFFGLGMELAALQKGKNHWWLRLLTAFSPIIAVAIIFVAFGMATADDIARVGGEISARSAETDDGEAATGVWDLFVALLEISSWGLWAMALGMVLSAVSVNVHPGRKKKKQPLPQPEAGQSTPDAGPQA